MVYLLWKEGHDERIQKKTNLVLYPRGTKSDTEVVKERDDGYQKGKIRPTCTCIARSSKRPTKTD